VSCDTGRAHWLGFYSARPRLPWSAVCTGRQLAAASLSIHASISSRPCRQRSILSAAAHALSTLSAGSSSPCRCHGRCVRGRVGLLLGFVSAARWAAACVTTEEGSAGASDDRAASRSWSCRRWPSADAIWFGGNDACCRLVMPRRHKTISSMLRKYCTL
jgi:hypothetical protein